MRLLNLYYSFSNGNEPKDAAFKRVALDAEAAGLSIDDLMLLTEADVTGSIGEGKNEKVVLWLRERISKLEKESQLTPKPLITGNDLKEIFGLKEGKFLGDILKDAYNYQIENDIRDRKEILRYVFKKYDLKIRVTKIVIGGPPHSGKSVFLIGLMKKLDDLRGFIHLIQACPDGEGTWIKKLYETGNEMLIKFFKNKGKHTKEIVRWYIKVLKNWLGSSMVLVDIGGATSEENRRIITDGEIEFGIILSRDLEEMNKWEEFFKECNVKILVKIFSDYNAPADVVDGDPMVVHHLERGEDVSDRPVIEKIAQIIREIYERRYGWLESDNLIKMLTGEEDVGITIDIGKIEAKINKGALREWEGKDLEKIRDLIKKEFHNFEGRNGLIRIIGKGPNFIHGGIVGSLLDLFNSLEYDFPIRIQIYSPDGFVTLKQLRRIKGGNGVDWRVIELSNGWTYIEFKLDPSKPLSPEDLEKIAVPEIPKDSKVIISGRGPHWFSNSILLTYYGIAQAIAMYQPMVGATVCVTNSKEVPLGTLIQFDVNEIMQPAVVVK